MQAPHSIAIVTVTYNSAKVIDDFLETVRRNQSDAITLIIIDNASTDGTLMIVDRFARSASISVRVVRNDQNLGLAAGNNQGIAIAQDLGLEWVALMNNDTFSDSSTFFSDLVAIATRERQSILSPAIAAVEPPATVWYAGGTLHPWEGYRNTHVSMGEPINMLDESLVVATDFAPACCLLVRTDVFSSVGLMDETFFVYGEDVDFVLRLREKGYRPFVANELKLTHKASSLTGGIMSDFSVRWITRNWVLLMRKHASILQLIVSAIYIQVWIWRQLMLRKDTLRQFRLRQRAYLEGWRVPKPGPRQF